MYHVSATGWYMIHVSDTLLYDNKQFLFLWIIYRTFYNKYTPHTDQNSSIDKRPSDCDQATNQDESNNNVVYNKQ